MEKQYAITFSGNNILTGAEKSIKMIYNNMVGINIKGKDYEDYLEFVRQQTGLNINKDNINQVKIVELN